MVRDAGKKVVSIAVAVALTALGATVVLLAQGPDAGVPPAVATAARR